MKDLLVGEPGAPVGLPPESHAERVRLLLLLAGLMLCVAGWLDVALLWYPPRFGESDWEFGTIAQSLDALPLPSMGLLLVAVAVLLRGRRGSVWIVTGVFGLVTLGLLATATLFALDVPQALSAVARDARLGPGIKRVLLKAGVFFVSYVLGYGLATLTLIRRARRLPAAA